MRKRPKEMIGASAKEPCAGCGQEIIGEGWDLVFFEWKGQWIGRVRHAFNEECANLLLEKFRKAKAEHAS